jgi:hypothetical protein
MFYVKYVMGETCVVAGTVLDDVMGGTCIIPGTALDVMGETCIIPGTALDVMGETCIIPGTALASQAFSCTLQQTRITMPKPELLSELPPETRNQNYTRTRIATFWSLSHSDCTPRKQSARPSSLQT